MALAYKIEPNRGVVTITGEYAYATEWLMFLGQLRRDGALPAHCNVLRDLRGADTPPNQAMATAIFNVIQRFWPELDVRRWAVLTDYDDDPVPLLMQALGEQNGLPIRMFTSFIDAVAWLQDDDTAD